MPKKKPAKKARMIKQEFDVDLTLLANRQLFLLEEIEPESAQRICKQLFALDTVNHQPIMIYIDSPGGDPSAGISIINAMKTVESPIVTIITGEACSTASDISIAGDKRACHETSSWMSHDLHAEIEGKSIALKDQSEYITNYTKMLYDHLRKYTNLTEKDILKSKHGELYLFADDMLDKGIVDEIIVHSKKKK